MHRQYYDGSGSCRSVNQDRWGRSPVLEIYYDGFEIVLYIPIYIGVRRGHTIPSTKLLTNPKNDEKKEVRWKGGRMKKLNPKETLWQSLGRIMLYTIGEDIHLLHRIISSVYYPPE